MLPLLPSARVTSLMLRLAASSLTIVTVAVPVLISASGTGLRIVTLNVSFASTRVSPVIFTVIFLFDSPRANVRVPLVDT